MVKKYLRYEILRSDSWGLNGGTNDTASRDQDATKE